MEFIMGGTIMFGGNFSPKNWTSCEGQLLAISQNQALFAILGTTWGGDGRTTFGIPDLRSRVPLGIGRGPGLSQINLGSKHGAESNKLVVAQLPSHTHTASFTGSGGSPGGSITATTNTTTETDTTTTMKVTSEEGNTNDPTDAYLALGLDGRNEINIYKKAPTQKTELDSQAITSTSTSTSTSNTVLSCSAGGITG